jgi:hypothetical protein
MAEPAIASTLLGPYNATRNALYEFAGIFATGLL